VDRLPKALTNLIADPFNYWFGVLVDALVAGGFFLHALRVKHGTWMWDAGVVLAGFGLYGFLEYVVHRWLYHDERSLATPGHRWHHDDPAALIAAPFFVPACVVAGLWGVFRHGLGEEAASWLAVALMAGLIGYELLHHGLHHWRLPARTFRILRGHHRIHHHFPDCNFGVTMTTWDWVFGTHYRSRRFLTTSDGGRGSSLTG
jgi:sterol desaturase/sphingolipid hydroxylase (fatty acid hydroxylase superfamily)